MNQVYHSSVTCLPNLLASSVLALAFLDVTCRGQRVLCDQIRVRNAPRCISLFQNIHRRCEIYSNSGNGSSLRILDPLNSTNPAPRNTTEKKTLDWYSEREMRKKSAVYRQAISTPALNNLK